MDKDLIKQVATMLGEEPEMVRQVIGNTEKYIYDTIKSGNLENVRIPVFGIFKVNLKKLRYLTQVKPSPRVKLTKGFPDKKDTQ